MGSLRVPFALGGHVRQQFSVLIFFENWILFSSL